MNEEKTLRDFDKNWEMGKIMNWPEEEHESLKKVSKVVMSIDWGFGIQLYVTKNLKRKTDIRTKKMSDFVLLKTKPRGAKFEKCGHTVALLCLYL